MSEIDRIYKYKTLLSGRRDMSREDMMQKLEISLVTFKRDIAKLRDQFHTPIVFDRDQGGYRLEQTDSTELPGMWFSQDEMLALMTIQSMIVQLEPGLLGTKLKPFQKRLDDMLASQGLDAATLTQRVRAVHAGKRRLPLTSFETLAKATLERKQVNVEHFTPQNGDIVMRDISPQQLVHYRDNWYVDAWCHLRGGLRSFSVDAITQATLLDQQAKDLDLFPMRQQLDGGYGIFGGSPKAWAQLRFTKARAAWVEHEIWHPEQKSQRFADGRYELVEPYADKRELIGCSRRPQFDPIEGGSADRAVTRPFIGHGLIKLRSATLIKSSLASTGLDLKDTEPPSRSIQTKNSHLWGTMTRCPIHLRRIPMSRKPILSFIDMLALQPTSTCEPISEPEETLSAPPNPARQK